MILQLALTPLPYNDIIINSVFSVAKSFLRVNDADSADPTINVPPTDPLDRSSEFIPLIDHRICSPTTPLIDDIVNVTDWPSFISDSLGVRPYEGVIDVSTTAHVAVAALLSTDIRSVLVPFVRLFALVARVIVSMVPTLNWPVKVPAVKSPAVMPDTV
jgi:hypothetical protein